MPPDPRLANAPISRVTACRLATHVFQWTGSLPSPHLRCDCGAYTWREWQEAQSGE